MIYKPYFLVIALFLFFSINSKGQENLPPAGPNEFYTTHYYSFKDASSKEIVYELQADLQKMQFVKHVDIRYNELKKSGNITLITLEKTVTRENEEGFKPTHFKKCILKYGITPLEYHVIQSSGK